MNMMPYIYTWLTLAFIVVGLAVRRAMVARHDDETLHLTEKDAAMVTQQAIVGRKIQKIDFWGQWLTVIAVLYGLALLEIYLSGVWAAGAKPPA